MKEVVLNLSRHTHTSLGWRADLGIEMSRWCQAQGLVTGVDYTWALDREHELLSFRFLGDNESFATAFGFRWSEYL